MTRPDSCRPVTAVLIGAGIRGKDVYGAWGLRNPQKIRFIAVAEPVAARREAFAREHGIEKKNIFSSWDELLAMPQLGEVCLVCTKDCLHLLPAVKALETGYHVLLEKPMATTLDDCLRLVETSERTGLQLRICHVARYTEFFSRVKRAVAGGMAGRPVNISHSENVAFWHFAHEYVRGQWGRADKSGPIILSKTCHDLDLLYWITDSRARNVQSFGSLGFFREENAPPGAPERCLDGCPHERTCLWYAPRLYVTGEQLVCISQQAGNYFTRLAGKLILDHPSLIRVLGAACPPLKSLVDWKGRPATVITGDVSFEGKMQALREGPYGRCVFRCGNDVPDHQTVNIEFDNGLTATLTMQGLSYLDGRWIRIDGSLGTLTGRFTHAGEKLSFFDHAGLKETVLWKRDMTGSSHGGGDEGLMESFVASLRNGVSCNDCADILTSARESLESHLMGFAAEMSRHEKRIVNLEELRRR